MPDLSAAKLEDQRRLLIRLLDERRPQGSLRNTLTIVFDGQPGVFGHDSAHTVKIVFSKVGSADDEIKRRVDAASNKSNMIVVTDDRALGYAVKALGAKVSSVADFMARMADSGERKPGSGSKPISRSQQSQITSEMSSIWLKPKGNDGPSESK